MKVFISWSGTTSHRVGLVFREWLPSVIQSLEPYVSSEDIDKGARWSTDIAKELEDSTFGILCVTKDNLHAPWLSFEAGALSKTMDKSFVTPFLFDIKRAEVNGPILQFQSTIFDKEDVKKLLNTLNKACGETRISQGMLDKAFDVWYPTLETELNKLKDIESEIETQTVDVVPDTQGSSIIEEILELSRDNQKLLRNPDVKINDQLADIKQRLEISLSRFERNIEIDERRTAKKYKSMFMDDLMHEVLPRCQKQYGFLIVLSMSQDEFPWIYNMGKELVNLIQTNVSGEIKLESINDFRRLLEFTCEHPMMRDVFGRRKDMMMLMKDMPYMLMDILKEIEMDLD